MGGIGLSIAYFRAEYASSTSNDVSAFTISQGGTGAITPLSGAPFPAGSGPSSVAVDPLDKFIFVSDEGSNSIFAYALAGFGTDHGDKT